MDNGKQAAMHVRGETCTDELAVRRYLEALRDNIQFESRTGASGCPISSRVETEFISVAARFGRANHISHTTWRLVGVGTGMLKRAGIQAFECPG